MELAFIIWAVGTLPSMAVSMCFLLFPVVLVSAVLLVSMPFIENDPDESKHNKFVATKIKGTSKVVFYVSLPLWFLFLLIPDKTTSYQMLAAYGVQTIVQNETTQELASDGVDVLKALMKKAKKELDVGTAVEK